MSGAEQRYYAGSWTNTDVYVSHEPINFDKALEEFNNFCGRQLPSMWQIPFIPTCFDVSFKEDYIVLGGPHGNVANFDVTTQSVLRDEDISYPKSILSVKLILQDNQVVALSDEFILYILDYPSFTTMHKLNLRMSNIVFRYRKQRDLLLFTNGTQEIFTYKVSTDEEFYMKKQERKSIKIEDLSTTFNLSDDDSLMAIAYENTSISIFFMDTNSKMKETGPNHSKAILVVFSQWNKHLAAAFEDFSVNVWGLEANLVLKYTYSTHQGKITGIAFVRENAYMLTSSEDKTISVCNLKGECQPYSMNIIDLKVLMMIGNKNHNKVFYIQDFDAMLAWEVPQVPKTTFYRGHESKVTKILFIPNTFELISLSEDGQFIIWDSRMDSRHESMTLEGKLLNGLVYPSGNKALIFSSLHLLYLVNLSGGNDFGAPAKQNFRHDVLCMQISGDESKLAIGDKQNRVRVFDLKNMLAELFIIKGHILPVVECFFINEDREIITASQDCTMCKWSITGNLSQESKIVKIKTFLGHQAAVSCMIVSADGYVVSGSEDGMIIFWNYDGNKLYSACCPDKIPVCNLYLSQDHSYFISLQESICTYWQLGNLSVLFQLNINKGGWLAVSNDEKFVALAEENQVSLSENPLGCSSIRIVGKSLGSPHKFMKFFLDCQKENSKVLYEMNYNHFIIAPYMIGPAHILAYCNRFNDLNEALFYEPNRASFFSTINDENPLSICIDMEFKNCIDICLKYMRQQHNGKNTFKNLRAFYPLQSCLTKLNAIDYPYIKKLYDGLFVRSEAEMLPRFCLHDTDLPVDILSEHFTVIPDQILPPNSSSHSGRPIVFFQSLFPLDLDIGTETSLEFLQSLLDCSEKEIFRSALIKEYLQFKWKKLKPTVYILGFIYIFYLILLGLYIVLFIESQDFLIALIIVHCIMWIYEILQIATDFSDYWKNVWNIQDQLRSLSFTFYAIMAWQENYNTDILLAVLIFSWARGIACFRMFDETRYMVRLVLQVIIDIQTFFFILFYATFAFAFVYYMRNPEAQPFLMYLTQAYRLDLGDFETGLTEAFDWIIFFAATMINPLIMLNLLIAIMSDTASAVAEIDDIFDLREMAEMIIDVEKVMFWKKGAYKKYYLHKCDFTQAEEQEDEDSNMFIREIKKQIVDIRRTVKNLKSNSKKIEEFNMQENLTELMNEHGVIGESMKSQFKCSDELIEDIQRKLNI